MLCIEIHCLSRSLRWQQCSTVLRVDACCISAVYGNDVDDALPRDFLTIEDRNNMSGNGFEHSVRVPRLYKTVTTIVQKVQEEGASLKQLVYQTKHPNIRGLYALALNTLKNGSQLDHLIRSTRILLQEPRLDPWLARVLITELLWGKQRLQSESKPVKTILSYQTELQKYLRDIVLSRPPVCKKVEKPRYVRVNTLHMSVSDVISSFGEEGWNILPESANYDEFLESIQNLNDPNILRDIHVPELLIFPSGTPFYNHEAYRKGAIVLQDKASCFPAFLLGATPGSIVMDMCAAPGMKTTHLAAILQNKGKIYAVERDLRRYETLRQMLEATHCSCVESINADVITIDSSKCPDVEYILVDPSCSGSGMTDRLEVDGIEEAKCAPGRIKSLQSFQVLILRHALLNFPKAKRIVYSTCSIYPEENEQVIDEVLASVGDAYRLVPIGTMLNGNWRHFSSRDYVCEDKCLYARPEIDMTNGFFVAIFERNFEVPLPECVRKKKKKDKLHEDNKNSVTGEKEKKKNRKKRRNEESESVPDVDTVAKNTSNPMEEMTVNNNTDCEVKSKEKKKNRKKKRNEESESAPDVDTVAKDTSNLIEEMIVNNNTDCEIKSKEKKKNRKKKRNLEESESVPESVPTAKDTSNAIDAMPSNNRIGNVISSKDKKKNRKKKRTTDTDSTAVNEDPTT